MSYSEFDPDELILRDHLARDRTILANERTLLAYLRTAIAFFAAGGTLVKVFPEDLALLALGVALLLVGLLVSAVGVCRFVTVGRRLRSATSASRPPGRAGAG